MEYVNLGNTDLKISKICLGTMTWGVQNNENEAFEQMNYALSQGVNFWDTAEMYAIPPTPETYGKTERIIGNWFEKTQKRDKVILATKFSPIPWARNEGTPKTNRKNIILAVDNSLKRLKTDYIDLYQLHWPTDRVGYHFDAWWSFSPASREDRKQMSLAKIEILTTFQELIEQGKVRYLGLSNDSSWGIKEFLQLSNKHNLPRVVSVQNEYNLLRRRDEHDIAETCSLEGVSYLPWSPLAMGVISGKYLDNTFPKGSRFSKEIMKSEEQWSRFKNRIELNTNNAVREYLKVARKHNLDICKMAIAFTLTKHWISSSIIGATSIGQLKIDIDAINTELSSQCLEDIQDIYKKYPVPF